MALTGAEFETILRDGSKRVAGDILWRENEDHSPWVEFRAEVSSDSGRPLLVQGSYNPLIPALSYVFILKTVGRVYGLDMGKDHHNPQCDQIGETHKHRWTERFRDKEAYVPRAITEPSSNPVAVWRQFCAKANLSHHGTMAAPSPGGDPL